VGDGSKMHESPARCGRLGRSGQDHRSQDSSRRSRTVKHVLEDPNYIFLEDSITGYRDVVSAGCFYNLHCTVSFR